MRMPLSTYDFKRLASGTYLPFTAVFVFFEAKNF